MKRSLRVVVGMGEAVPSWYGVAWHLYHSAGTVCYPVPLNLVAAAVRGLWILLRYGYRPVPIEPRAAFFEGRQAARNDLMDAWRRGARQGIQEAHAGNICGKCPESRCSWPDCCDRGLPGHPR